MRTFAKPLILAALSAFSLAAFAAPTNFKVVSNAKAKSSVSFESVTDVETIVGKTGNVSGTISYDPKTGTGGGTIVIDVKSIDTGIPLRNEHMFAEQWLDAAKYPNITFKATKVKKAGGDKFNVTGIFTLHGVSKTITTDVTLKHVKASTASKAAGFAGDAVQVSTKFKVKLSDYGVKIAGKAVGKVNNEVTISLNAVGDSK